MFKIAALFSLFWLIFGNPVVAVIVLLLLLYVLERRFIGLSPSLVRPFRRRNQLAKQRRQLAVNPHDVSAKMEAVRLLIEMKRYGEARGMLLEIESRMDHSAEYWSDLGLCELALGRLDEGEAHMLRALKISPRVKYGQPYLRLGEAFASRDAAKALDYLQRFREIHSSSCEAYYRMGNVYASLGRREEARQAYRECGEIYRSLPRYMKRQERKWALRAYLKNRG